MSLRTVYIGRFPRRLVAALVLGTLCSLSPVLLWPQAASSPPAAPVVPASGPGFSTLAAFTLPPTFYVGDKVELRIRLKLDSPGELRIPAEMPHDQWIRVESISITKAKEYSVVHIYFASFAPGTRTFPDINLGSIQLRGIRVTTTSLLSEGRTRLTDPKGQLLLPGSTLILGIAIALVVGLPLLLFVLYRRTRLKVAEMIESRRAKKPWRALKRALDALDRERPPRNARRFYITLIDAIRRYLTVKFGSNFRTVTAREFDTASAKTAVGREAGAVLAEILRFGDLVKFAGTPASEENLTGDLARVREVVGAIEERAERDRGTGGREAAAEGQKVSG